MISSNPQSNSMNIAPFIDEAAKSQYKHLDQGHAINL